ncbi:MAG TPA: MFS transporter [Bryobacteraceae bacterium]|jgi:MFS family permease
MPYWLTERKWIALWAAFFGYMLDAMDVLLYVFAIQTLRAEFHMSNAVAGLASSLTLILSAGGGIASGILSDRLGRRRVMIWSILIYSLASGGTATSRTIAELLFWRALVGIGLGAQWSAGATLVAESWDPSNRGKALSLMQSGWAFGYMLAAAITPYILGHYNWRVLFLVGLLPALLTVWVRRNVTESEVWTQRKETGEFSALFRAPYLSRTLRATTLATSVLFAYWGLFTWLPGFLSAPAAQGGAGLNIVKTSQWMFVMQFGTFLGYITFGWLADRFGRRPAFAFYVLMAAGLTFVYGMYPRWAGTGREGWLLLIGPLVGFFGTGYFSLFGATLAELYPTSIRGAGQGFTYNFGRGLSALAPYLVGAIADRNGLGSALVLNSGFFLIAAGLVFTLPETKAKALD